MCVNIHAHTSNVIQLSNKNIKISLVRCGNAVVTGNAYFLEGNKYLHPLRERYCISENAQIVYVPMKNQLFFYTEHSYQNNFYSQEVDAPTEVVQPGYECQYLGKQCFGKIR